MSRQTGRSSTGRRILRFAYYTAHNLPDRILHGRRHREVRERLSRSPRPREILVVCYGNVCRSPYMEAVLQHALPDIVVSSAGFFGSDRAAPEIAVALGARRGVDLSRHRSRPLTPSTVGASDLIVVMDAFQSRQLKRLFPTSRASLVIAGDLDPEFDSSRAIRDPWDCSTDVFESSFNRLDRCAAVLVSVLRLPS